MSCRGKDCKVEQGAVLEYGPLVQLLGMFAAVVDVTLSVDDHGGGLRLICDVDGRVGGGSDGAVRRDVSTAHVRTARTGHPHCRRNCDSGSWCLWWEVHGSLAERGRIGRESRHEAGQHITRAGNRSRVHPYGG